MNLRGTALLSAREREAIRGNHFANVLEAIGGNHFANVLEIWLKNIYDVLK